MLRDYRCYVIAALGCLILAAASGQGRPGKAEQRQTEQQIANALRGIDASLQKADRAGQRNEPCRDQQDNSRSDLCAQWTAANAASRSASWAEYTFYLGFAATLIGLLTLGAAVAAAYFARKAAHHTERAANETKRSADAAELGVRPHVHFGDVKMTVPLTLLSKVEIEIKNNGMSPAMNVQLGHADQLVKRPILEQARELPIRNWSAPSPFGPQTTTKLRASLWELSEGDISAIRNGEKALIARHVVRYEDRYGNPDSSETWIYIDKFTEQDGGEVMELNDWARLNSHKRPDATQESPPENESAQ